MAKVIFDITENDAVPTDKSGHISVPVTISVGIEGLNDGRPGHSECLAFIDVPTGEMLCRNTNVVITQHVIRWLQIDTTAIRS
ncbi:hypothetical protein M5J15_07370 [Serratia symbiotica]|uniref:hypothetical protein n=1 Tax=Serratia symbiotica TaxID=138074 RepID=UPI002091405A|nr:hypothetical protein [Serratia symbiotica]USS96619.1 hypothetical protein M5J15_07370 [Serratia symbiotica]